MKGSFGITDGVTLVGNLAQYPDTGYLKAVKIDDPEKTNGWGSNDKFKENLSDNIPQITDDSQLYVSIWPNGEGWYNWFQDVSPIYYETGNDNVRTFYFPNGKYASLQINNGSRYKLIGAREFLDAPGEFYYNTEERKIEFIPPVGFDMTSDTILYSTGSSAFTLEGTSEEKIHNIKFDSLDITGVNRLGAAINMKYAEDIEVKSCRIHDCLGWGIYAKGVFHNLKVEDCEISNTGSEGVYFLSATENTHKGPLSGSNLITNNHVYNVGMLEGHASGIHMRNTGGDTVSNNSVHGSKRIGIQVYGTIHRKNVIGQTIEGEVVTEDNAHEFVSSRGNVIEYNDVYDCMTDSQDGGPIYLASHDNIVRYNHMHDCSSNLDHIEGLYLDLGSSKNMIYGNAVYNFENNANGILALYLIGGCGNTVINNIAANNEMTTRGYVFRLSSPGCVLKNNISYNSGTQIARIDDTYKTFTEASDCDNNIYYNSDGSADWKFLRISGEATEKTWEEWKALGYDENSKTENPDFIDALKGDFRVSGDSVARDMGFEEIASQNIGVDADYSYPQDAEIEKIFICTEADMANRGLYTIEETEELTLRTVVKNKKGFVVDVPVSFSSDNVSAVSVSQDGKLTVNDSGTAKITANSGNVSTVVYIKASPKYVWFTDSAGQYIYKIPEIPAEITANADLGEFSQAEAALKIAVYNGSELVKIEDKFTNVNNKYEAKLDLNELIQYTHIKAFCWKEGTLVPILDAAQLNK